MIIVKIILRTFMLIDLHAHTTASDGQLSPAELVNRAENRQVHMLAITDHDTVDGLVEARKTIIDKQLNITLINGIEISTNWLNHEIHVLGVNIDPHSTPLTAMITEQKEKREARAIEIGERLAKANIPNTYDGAKALAGTGAITRAHFARYLIEIGVGSSFKNIFEHYLSKGNTGYVPHHWVDLASAISIIHQAGGEAILAHPTHYKLSNKWIRRLLSDFKSFAGDAIEVAMGQQTPEMRLQLALWSNEYGLKASQGSDFHFVGPWRDLGKSLVLPDIATPVWATWSIFKQLSEAKIPIV